MRALVLLPLLTILTACASPQGSAPEVQSAPAQGEGQAADPAPAERRFRVRYVAELVGLTPGNPVRLWLPLPADDPFQTISDVQVDSSLPSEIRIEPEYGNRVVLVSGPAPAEAFSVGIEYDVRRAEREEDLSAAPTLPSAAAAEAQRYLRPARLGPLDDEVRRRAAAALAAAGDPTNPVARARALFDCVLATMTYDKSGQGWGRGDAQYACEVGRGNCTDYHSLFIALCQASGLPARFQIGLFGPYAPSATPVDLGQSYHCWAEFWAPGHGWVPVDISEADKDPRRREAFFGGHSANRVTLSTGRDLVLAPAQQAAPVNFFVEPYVEVDGRPFGGVRRRAVWTDLP